MERFNDVIADPAGRVYAGTIGTSRESGGLYRVDLDGTVTKLFAGTGCANGMGFTPDGQHFTGRVPPPSASCVSVTTAKPAN
jgi:D-xylonolactonase